MPSIKRYKPEDLKQATDRTDYERLTRMTEDEIRHNAETDPDAPPPSDVQLARFEKVKTPRGAAK